MKSSITTVLLLMLIKSRFGLFLDLNKEYLKIVSIQPAIEFNNLNLNVYMAYRFYSFKAGCDSASDTNHYTTSYSSFSKTKAL